MAINTTFTTPVSPASAAAPAAADVPLTQPQSKLRATLLLISIFSKRVQNYAAYIECLRSIQIAVSKMKQYTVMKDPKFYSEAVWESLEIHFGPIKQSIDDLPGFIEEYANSLLDVSPYPRAASKDINIKIENERLAKFCKECEDALNVKSAPAWQKACPILDASIIDLMKRCMGDQLKHETQHLTMIVGTLEGLL